MIRDDIVLLDNKTFDYIDKENIYVVEKDMAEIIRTLNKKGYITIKQDDGNYGNYILADILIENIKDKIDENVIKNTCYTTIYILFKEDYNFNKPPLGFSWAKNTKLLFYTHNYYEENPFKMKSIDKLEEEKENILILLKEWADKLPNR